MSTVTPRLDLDSEVVDKAKLAVAFRQNAEPFSVALKDIPFSITADLAIREFGEGITNCLEKAGFRRQQKVERGRPRRLPEELWQKLGEIANVYDTSRVSVLRAALALLANEVPAQSKGCLGSADSKLSLRMPQSGELNTQIQSLDG